MKRLYPSSPLWSTNRKLTILKDPSCDVRPNHTSQDSRGIGKAQQNALQLTRKEVGLLSLFCKMLLVLSETLPTASAKAERERKRHHPVVASVY